MLIDTFLDPHPFLKWVGGKRQLLRELRKYVPGYGVYHEPFVGGAALFFDLRPTDAILSDWNERLIRTYTGVRDNVESVIELLHKYRYEKPMFLETRKVKIDDRSDAEVAAWFIYLNRTCYNGLYRVNSKNGFNAPFGKYKNPTICDEPLLRSCCNALKGVELIHTSFETVLARAVPGDFVYFDSPYIPLTVTSSFTSYTSDKFGMLQQIQLRDVALELKRKGVSVLLSNSSAPIIKELYQGFSIVEVGATRAINTKADGRGKVNESLIF
jgi:DNA adenine methylase